MYSTQHIMYSSSYATLILYIHMFIFIVTITFTVILILILIIIIVTSIIWLSSQSLLTVELT